jgi:hypothetical protein
MLIVEMETTRLLLLTKTSLTQLMVNTALRHHAVPIPYAFSLTSYDLSF